MPEVPAQELAKEVQQEPVGERETTIDDEEQFLVPQVSKNAVFNIVITSIAVSNILKVGRV